MFVSASALTVLKLWKRFMLCGGGGVSMGNCRNGFMSRRGWITVGVRRNVGTAAPALLILPKRSERQTQQFYLIFYQGNIIKACFKGKIL